MLNTMERRSFIKKIILWAVIAGGLIALFVPRLAGSVYAADVIDPCDLGGCVTDLENSNGDAESTIVNLIINIAKIMIGIVAALSVLYIILGAFFIITGLGGDGPTYEKGLKIFKNAILGLVLALLAFTIVSLITGALGEGGLFSGMFQTMV